MFEFQKKKSMQKIAQCIFDDSAVNILIYDFNPKYLMLICKVWKIYFASKQWKIAPQSFEGEFE